MDAAVDEQISGHLPPVNDQVLLKCKEKASPFSAGRMSFSDGLFIKFQGSLRYREHAAHAKRQDY
ncbi:hypothetical protein [Halovenus salina]|uniref:hypothetical protein n=1 Tax=Halovenus salina TaxID=1510225 RepID=UPI0022608586|nr:hypothetical protein [Halovenus salina]